MKIPRPQLLFNTTALGQAVRMSERRHPPRSRAKKLAQRTGLSLAVAEVIHFANGHEPSEQGSGSDA